MKLNPQTQKDNIFISNKKKKLNVELKSGPSLKTADTKMRIWSWWSSPYLVLQYKSTIKKKSPLIIWSRDWDHPHEQHSKWISIFKHIATVYYN